MELTFQEYNARKVVNIHKHVDSWFWDKYSASPYTGCRGGCEFCYLRGGHYLGQRDPSNFNTLIKAKINTVEILRKELSRLKPDIISCGDWQQPAEEKYSLSHGMLEVVQDLSFPLLVIERSPLLIRDIDLLIAINQKTWVGVIISLSNVDPSLKRAFEPYSPSIKSRLKAMETLAKAGILVGAALMPIIPFAGDDKVHLEDAVLAIRDSGGTFILGAGMTMDGVQAERVLKAAQRLDPTLDARWRQLYDWQEGGKKQYSPPQAYTSKLGLTVRELCSKYGLKDRMQRYIMPGNLSVNKRVAERLFLKSYDLELERANIYRIWSYRKAAWAVDDWPENINDIYRTCGQEGIQALPDVGKNIAAQISGWLEAGITNQQSTQVIK